MLQCNCSFQEVLVNPHRSFRENPKSSFTHASKFVEYAEKDLALSGPGAYEPGV